MTPPALCLAGERREPVDEASGVSVGTATLGARSDRRLTQREERQRPAPEKLLGSLTAIRSRRA